MARVVIAGAGTLGQALATRLSPSHQVRGVRGWGPLPESSAGLSWYQADLTTIHGAELALCGAHTVVMLAQARRPWARYQRASPADLDSLLADSVGRAATLVDLKHLVLFACGENDARLPLLERSGVPLSVLRGGAPDPVEQLAALVESGPDAQIAPSGAWSGPSAPPRPGPFSVCSVQRYPRPAGWSAMDLARAYFKWLPSSHPLVSVAEWEGTFTIHLAGVRALVLRLVPGRSQVDCAYFEVADGDLGASSAGARFEFRLLQDGQTALIALVGYRPRLPWLVYRLTQAVLHERAMRLFGTWLSEQGNRS